MAGHGIRQCLNDITAYLILLIVISTLGSLQFGFHLVRRPPSSDLIFQLEIDLLDRLCRDATC